MIGFETLNAATTLVRMLLESHENDINKAYSKAEGQLSIALECSECHQMTGGPA